MKTNTAKLFAGGPAAAVFAGCTGQARASWTDGGQGGGAVEQPGFTAAVRGAGMAPGGFPNQLPGVNCQNHLCQNRSLTIRYFSDKLGRRADGEAAGISAAEFIFFAGNNSYAQY